MRRRAFIAAGATAIPLGAWGQQPGARPTIGYLGANSAAAQARWTTAFVERLRELGWVEGRNIAIEYRWSDGRRERYSEIASEFVALKVSVIVAAGNEASSVAKRATSTIPVVFPVAGDPVGTGLVASLARPGGNLTGLSIQQTDLASKRVELIREVIPGCRRIAIMGNVGSPNSVKDMAAVESTIRALGLEVSIFGIRGADDIAPAFGSLKGRADALYVSGDPLVNTNRDYINSLALAAQMPTVYGFRELVEAGGLMSYGPNFPDLFRRSADIVDRILRGAKPAEIPIEQPTKFELVVNLKTAKALRLTVDPSILARADDVIE
ncbi:ABC transporter substrate-binding protein [Reyranella sp.]|uniref:ABC transporter substrate-binding protein n=1 Tax=Reyranella sp. TaxID=1929291 RepID=UPI002F939002